MRKLVSNLTAAMLLVHVLAGCCRHLDLQPTAGESAAHGETADGCCCHHHDTPADDAAGPHEPCDCQVECKSLCVSLPPEKADFDAGQSTVCLDGAAIQSMVGAADVWAAHSSCDAGPQWSKPRPPLRIHLLHQIIQV